MFYQNIATNQPYFAPPVRTYRPSRACNNSEKKKRTHTSHTRPTPQKPTPNPSRREGSLIVSFLRLCIYFHTLKV